MYFSHLSSIPFHKREDLCPGRAHCRGTVRTSEHGDLQYSICYQVSAIQNELENGRDRAAQERDMQTLEELKQLADIDTVLSGGCPADQRAPETVL